MARIPAIAVASLANVAARGAVAPMSRAALALVASFAAACEPQRIVERESAITASTELPVDLAVSSQESGVQYRPQLACIGDTCLAVWGEYDTYPIPHKLQAARVNSITGAVIDATPVAVTSTLAYATVPFDSLSCAGSDCIAAWLDARGGGTKQDVYAARLDATTMAVADPSGIAISTSGSDSEPVVACCGSECFVSWHDYGAAQWLGVRISPTTGAIDATPTVLPDRVNAATCTGAGWLLVQDFGVGMRVAADGTLIDSTPLPLTSSASAAFDTRVACDGTDCLVVFADERYINMHWWYDIYSNRFDAAAGTVLDANDTALTTDHAFHELPSAACIGTSCVVAFESFPTGTQTQIWGARVDLATDAVADINGFPIYTTGSSVTSIHPDQLPSVACGTGTCMIAWQSDDALQTEHVYASRLDPVTAAVGDPNGIVLALGPNDETNPAVTCAGGDCLAIWIDTRGPFPRGFGVRVDPAQVAVLDAEATRLTSYTSRIRTACGNADCLVVWEAPGSNGYNETDAIDAVRVSRTTGLATDGMPFAIANYGFNATPSVACDGDRCVVVWWQVGSVVGSRVDLATGVVSDPGGVVLSAQGGSAPAVACANGTCLVAWSGSYIYAARYDLATGVTADAPALQLSTGASSSTPAASCSGTSCLVSWQELPPGGGWEIHGARVNLVSGAVADVDLLLASSAITSIYAIAQDVACEGDDCVLVWQDQRGGAPDLFLTRVDKHSDTVLDPQGAALTASPDLENAPAIAADGNGNYVIAYSRPDVAVDGVQRVELIVTAARQAGQPCSDDAQCFDTSCVAGICGAPRDAGIDALVDSAVAPGDAGVPDASAPNGLVPLQPPGCGCMGGGSSNFTCAFFVLLALRFRANSRDRRSLRRSESRSVC